MLLQTNSYIVPRDKRTEHARLLRKFRQVLLRMGCDDFQVYEQMGPNWAATSSSGRFVQILRFRDRTHLQSVQHAEREDAEAQELIASFCRLVNIPYQQQQGLFASAYYQSIWEAASGEPTESAAAEHPHDHPHGHADSGHHGQAE